MAERSFLTVASWTLAIVLAGLLLVRMLRTPPAPVPVTTPVATTLAPERAPEPPAFSDPTAGSTPAPEPSPVAPVGTPPPQAAASASAPPSPDAAEAERAEQEQRIRSELATAKARAESLSAASQSECPDLKPGELRHPGALSHCARLRSEAAQAVNHYETLKKEALAAGIVVP